MKMLAFKIFRRQILSISPDNFNIIPVVRTNKKNIGRVSHAQISNSEFLITLFSSSKCYSFLYNPWNCCLKLSCPTILISDAYGISMYSRYENLTAVLTKTSVFWAKMQCIHVYGYDVVYICVWISTFQSSLLPWPYEELAVLY
jgi:hypothetical protein